MLGMDEIAVASSFALTLGVLPALGLAEIRDWTVFYLYGVLVVVLAGHGAEDGFSLLFGGELNIEVANHMLSNVVCYDHVEDFSLLGILDKYFLKEFFKVMCCFPELFLRSLDALGEGNGCPRIGINMEEQ